MTSVMANTPFQKHELTYEIVKPDPAGGRDANGNPKTITETGKVVATLSASTGGGDFLLKMVGADVTSIRVIGELVEPLTFPAGVILGAKLTTVYGGQQVELELTKIVPNDLPVVRFGDYFEAQMRTVP